MSRIDRPRSLAALAVLALVSSGAEPAPAPDPAPPHEGAWRPGEALALLLKPPPEGIRPIDDEYLEFVSSYRERIAAADSLEAELRPFERVDEGGKRVWYFLGPDPVILRIDVGNDGTWDQAQYFGAEGLFAIVHVFSQGRRTQRIYWPPGQRRIVEIRNNDPPFPGIWWRTDESPFPAPPTPAAENTPSG